MEARMQELKARQQSPFTIDKACLAQQRPGLLLTQDACQAFDVDSSAVAKVSNCSLITKGMLGPLHAFLCRVFLGSLLC